jgi:hypothetical protein
MIDGDVIDLRSICGCDAAVTQTCSEAVNPTLNIAVNEGRCYECKTILIFEGHQSVVIMHGCTSVRLAKNPIYLARERIHIPAIGAVPHMVTIPTCLTRSARVRHARDINRVLTAGVRLPVTTRIRTTLLII